MAATPGSVSRDEVIREFIRRKRCAESLHSFALNVDIPTAPHGAIQPDEELTGPAEKLLAPHHAKILTVCERTIKKPFGRALIMAPPGSAKALALDTPIPTPTGWTTMGALRVGDKVFGDDGLPCQVTWVSPVHRGDTYKVRTDCGDEIIAHADHEWRLQLDRKSAFHIHDTRALARHRSKRALVERAKPLYLPEADLPIPPYFLGVWLGDGHSSGMRITSGDEDREWLRAELEKLGVKTTDQSARMQFGVIGWRSKFVAEGLLHDPEHNTYGRKHIPAKYLRASIRQRIDLLQGLIDTDGTISRKQGCATFCNTNLELAEQVRELVRSLGVKAGWSETRAKVNGKDCGPAYKVSFYRRDAARMPRKAALCRDQHRTPHTYLEAVQTMPADTVCIEVDSPTHLFLCGRSMTPTHNSTYVSTVVPPWAMGRIPGTRIILTSYASKLAEKQSRRARQIAESEKYRELWNNTPVIVKDSDPEWTLDSGSELLAAGLLAGITGNRANGAVIDDPVAGREEADSPATRARTLDAYQDDLLTRLLPGAWVILIMTRWNEQDLAGEILPLDYKGESGMILCRDGLWWDVLNIPAKAEHKDDPLGRKPGEYLWPEYYPEKHWKMFETGQGPTRQRTWASLYQQRPSPQGSGNFTREMFRFYDTLPEHVRSAQNVMCSDFAVTEGKNDSTDHGIATLAHNGDLYFLDWWSKQSNTGEGVDEWLRLVIQYKINVAFNEGGVIDKAIRPLIDAKIRDYNKMQPHGKKVFVDLKSLPSMQDKIAKCAAFQGRCGQGTVYFPRRAPWTEYVIEQLLALPAGRHDDAADVAGLFGRAIPQLSLGAPPKVMERREGIKPFTAAWIEWQEDLKPAVRWR